MLRFTFFKNNNRYVEAWIDFKFNSNTFKRSLSPSLNLFSDLSDFSGVRSILNFASGLARRTLDVVRPTLRSLSRRLRLDRQARDFESRRDLRHVEIGNRTICIDRVQESDPRWKNWRETKGILFDDSVQCSWTADRNLPNGFGHVRLRSRKL